MSEPKPLAVFETAPLPRYPTELPSAVLILQHPSVSVSNKRDFTYHDQVRKGAAGDATQPGVVVRDGDMTFLIKH